MILFNHRFTWQCFDRVVQLIAALIITAGLLGAILMGWSAMVPAERRYELRPLSVDVTELERGTLYLMETCMFIDYHLPLLGEKRACSANLITIPHVIFPQEPVIPDVTQQEGSNGEPPEVVIEDGISAGEY